eukprot:CAMPEP_0119344552 /NCGR_PEP_ID=MMETSP1333-20130426/107029_1 /TAXON_ID=418940 /ORGANISM="Scyphosphaera apsteinii, Strain RCC1455" /LENGTH=110 /DNA_ID=CAMNT_0007356991 /DNA_START=495 /DNA_END=827 /DNA_ORIENTATION=+
MAQSGNEMPFVLDDGNSGCRDSREPGDGSSGGLGLGIPESGGDEGGKANRDGGSQEHGNVGGTGNSNVGFNCNGGFEGCCSRGCELPEPISPLKSPLKSSESELESSAEP